jgi:hypothetical protein
MNASKYLQKDFLHHITGIRLIPQQAIHHIENGLFVPIDQLLVSAFDTGAETSQNPGLFF